MSDESAARSSASPALPAPDEYDAICAVLMDSERGRWFLQEYARRSRSADTQLLLAAIKRIEGLLRVERSWQARQSFRSDLLEMAKAITRTRAEVAEMKPAAVSGMASSRPAPTAPFPPPRGGDPVAGDAREGADSGNIVATAERIRDVTWAMRGHGFDPSTCDQLEELAGSILSASTLRDPTDRRARKLSEVLHYLEHRIDAMLESCSDGAATHDADRDPFEPAAIGPSHSPWSSWPPAELAPTPPASEALVLRPPSISLLPGPVGDRSGKSAAPAQAALRPPAPVEARATVEGTPPPPADDPFAPLKAMSEAERIALFS
jgi:hypothetical protein